MSVSSYGQELAIARRWIDASSEHEPRLRDLAAELLAALWNLSLSDRFIHELLGHNHRFVFDGFAAELRRKGRTLDELDTAHALGMVRRLSPEDRTAVFEIVQNCLDESLVKWGS